MNEILRTIVRFGFVLSGFAWAGCGGDDPAVQDDIDSSISLQCVDEAIPSDPGDDVAASDALSTSSVERCIFDRGAKTLSLILEGQGQLRIGIANFTGAGTYETDQEGETIVELTGKGDSEGNVIVADTAGDLPGDDSPAFPATLKATSEFGEEEGATGWLKLDVNAPKVGAAAIGKVRCDVSPASFSITVSACQTQ